MKMTILDLGAEPVGGWWPEDVGARSGVRVRGPLHPLGGKVVRRAVEADMLPLGTVVDCGTVVDPIDGALIGHVRVKQIPGWTGARHANPVGGKILYVPLERE